MIIGTTVFQLLMVGVVALKGSFAASCLVPPFGGDGLLLSLHSAALYKTISQLVA